jgi:ABC-type sugar transport system ATPase subunit
VALLELTGVSKAYGEVRAVKDLSLAVEEGERMTLLGPSGSGKSTVLRLVAGLETPDEGTIRIDGVDVTDVQAADRGVSMVFQSFALFPHMSVAQNIGFGLAARKTPPDETRRLVEEVAEWLALTDLLKRRPSQLSGGERQRVALARGLVRRPQLLLMDEPLSNLDAQLRVQTRAEIRRIHAEARITLLYVTHDQAEALSLGDRVTILDGGRLQQCGPPETVYERPANRFVAGFLGSPPMNLLEARVDGMVLRAEGIEVSLGDRLPAGTNAVVLGFRPEDVVASAPRSRSGLSFEGIVEVREQVGHERLWHVRAGRHRLIMRVGAGDTAAEGELIRASVPASAVQLFDPATGEAL